MVNWDDISSAELQTLAAIANQHNVGIATIVKKLSLLTGEERRLVITILKQGLQDEGLRQVQQQDQLRSKIAGA